MVDELAKARFDRAKYADEVAPSSALNACLDRVRKGDIKSIYILAVTDDGDLHDFSAGPVVATESGVYMLLQRAIFDLLNRRFGG